MAEKMMVVAAHMGDFVWRCGGSIAKYAQEGNEVLVLV
ncbi:MAG: PIG-L domain-containing protein, partial [Oscillospiraceae bacterium]